MPVVQLGGAACEFNGTHVADRSWPDSDGRESTQRPDSQLPAFGDSDVERLNERKV